MTLVIGAPIIIIFAVLGFLLPIIAIIDVIKHEFTGSNKLIWILLILFLPLIGSILYFIIGKKQKLKKGI